MSEEIKELTDKEAMKILGEFATTCYDNKKAAELGTRLHAWAIAGNVRAPLGISCCA